MIAVRCFSLCVVETSTDLHWLNPRDWPKNIPDLQYIVIAGELRGREIAQQLPQGINRSWLPKQRQYRSRLGIYLSHRWAMDDSANALNTRRPRTMLILPEVRANILARRLDSFKQPTLMRSTLWNVEPRRKGEATITHPDSGRVVDWSPSYLFMFQDPKPKLVSSPVVLKKPSRTLPKRDAPPATKIAAE